MMHMSCRARVCAVLALLLPLTGCGDLRSVFWQPRSAAPAIPTSGGFDPALSAAYGRLALEEEAAGDSDDAARFGRKSDAAAAGGNPLPDHPQEYPVAPESHDDAVRAYRHLIALRDAWRRDANAESQRALAEAQARFDCWIDALGEPDLPRRRACRRAYWLALGEAHNALRPAAAAAPQTARSTAGVERIPREEQRYVLLFPTGSATLSADARETAAFAAQAALEQPNLLVLVIGHADSQGASRLNDRLAQQRAAAVRDFLVAIGVPESRITSRSQGENAPIVFTADGVAEPANRRVEIVLR